MFLQMELFLKFYLFWQREMQLLLFILQVLFILTLELGSLINSPILIT